MDCWPSSAWFEHVWPLVFVGLDEVLAEDFSGAEFGHGYGCLADVHEDPFTSVFCSGSEVVHFACAAE